MSAHSESAHDRRLSCAVGEPAADRALPCFRSAGGGCPGRPAGRAQDGRANSASDNGESVGRFATHGQASGPARAATPPAFSANCLFAGLARPILGTTLHHPSHALSGATLFLVFSCGVASQLATARLQASRVLALGTISMLLGLVLLVVSVRLSAPSLAMFPIGGALIGAGAGAVFKGTTGLVLEASPPENRLAMTSALLIALFVGLSVPVIGAGVALSQGASAPDTVLGFAVLVGLGAVGTPTLRLGASNHLRRKTSPPRT